MKQKLPSRIQGFTLVELMVVIVIMAILASLVMLNINGVTFDKTRNLFPLPTSEIQANRSLIQIDGYNETEE